eukprot:5497321-Alexandrium_andersonii.AAC.1
MTQDVRHNGLPQSWLEAPAGPADFTGGTRTSAGSAAPASGGGPSSRRAPASRSASGPSRRPR